MEDEPNCTNPENQDPELYQEQQGRPNDEQAPEDPQIPVPPPPPNFGFGDTNMENFGAFDDQGPPVPHFASYDQDLSAFPGDPYAATDMDITRGVAEPVCLINDGDVGVPPPFLADYHGLGASFLQDLQGPGGFSDAKEGIFNKEFHYPGEIPNQQLQAVSAAPVTLFQSGSQPPKPPDSPHFTLRGTSIYAIEEGFKVANMLLAFLRRDYVTFDLKVRTDKFTIKTDVIVDCGGSALTIKVRTYKLPTCVCLEFQRQAGDAFEFGSLYRKVATLFEVQKFPASRSLEQLMSQNCAAESLAQRGLDSAHGQMSVEILAVPVSPSEDAQKESYFEPLLYQAASMDPKVRAEAAKAMAGLALQTDKAELLKSLVEPNAGTGETPLLALLGLRDSCGPSALGYSEANLIEALFQEPRCTEMLWKSSKGIEAWQGILDSFTNNATSVACLTKLSSAVRDICVVLAAVVDEKVAEDVRAQIKHCLEESGHRSDVVRCNLQDAMLQMPNTGYGS